MAVYYLHEQVVGYSTKSLRICFLSQSITRCSHSATFEIRCMTVVPTKKRLQLRSLLSVCQPQSLQKHFVQTFMLLLLLLLLLRFVLLRRFCRAYSCRAVLCYSMFSTSLGIVFTAKQPHPTSAFWLRELELALAEPS